MPFSFTISATIYAIHKRTDIIGALVFSLLTCFGGGMIRDIALGQMPNILTNRASFNLAIVSIVVCLICYHLSFIKRVHTFFDKHEHNVLLEISDALGLASFVVTGIEIAIQNNVGVVLMVFAGCITGVGGGILRDICSAQIPSVFRKHIYLIPVIIASLFFSITYTFTNMPEFLIVIITIAIIITIRMLAFKFKWNLPIPKGEEETEAKKEEKELSIK